MSAINHYRRLLELLPQPASDVGEVIGLVEGGVAVELLSGSTVTVRGSAAIGTLVYVKDGAIVGPAPMLPMVEIEV